MSRTKWIDSRFGQQLKRMRDERGWTQPQMSQMLSDKGIAPMHATTLAKIEAGTRSVRINEAVAIADLLDMSLDLLLGRRPDHTTLTFALTTLSSYVKDAENQIGQARRASTDIEDQLDNIADNFDSPHIEALQRAARAMDGHLDNAQKLSNQLEWTTTDAIIDAGKERKR